MVEEKKVEVVAPAPATPAAPAVEKPNIMASVIHADNEPVITMKKLLEAGVHFGHQTRRWNPKMEKFIYGARNGIYIIDLQKSAAKIDIAYKAMKKIVDEGGKILFVGTKKQCQDAVKEEALRSGSFYITNRWLGGTLTNFRTIQNRIRYLKELEKKEEDGSFELLPKKEVALLKKEKDKLSKNLEGIKEMRKTPNAVFVVDPRVEHNAVAEAHALGIPVFGIVDTNCDPDEVDFPIPANDDAIRSVRLVLGVLADAVVESKGGQPLIAYTKDVEGAEVTMKDAIRQADRTPVRREEGDRPHFPYKERTTHSDKPYVSNYHPAATTPAATTPSSTATPSSTSTTSSATTPYKAYVAAAKAELAAKQAAAAKPEVKAEVKPEVKAEVKPEVKVEVKAEVKAEVKPEVKAEAKPAAAHHAAAKPVAKSEAKAEVKPEAKAAK